jgi:hypothetical protein
VAVEAADLQIPAVEGVDALFRWMCEYRVLEGDLVTFWFDRTV